MPEIASKAKYISVTEAIALGIEPHEFLPWEEMDPNEQILFVEDEEDLQELTIEKGTHYDVSRFTDHPFLYEVNFVYTEQRARQLLEYLRENSREGQILELWNVWLGAEEHDQEIPEIRVNLEELSLDHIAQIYNSDHKNYQEQGRIVLDCSKTSI